MFTEWIEMVEHFEVVVIKSDDIKDFKTHLEQYFKRKKKMFKK